MDMKAQLYRRCGSEMHGDMQRLIEGASAAKKYRKDEIIYHQGDNANYFCYLKKGRVKVYMTSADGMEKVLNTAGPGELLGEGAFFDKKPRVSSAGALTDAEVIMIDEEKLTGLISRYPRLAFELLEILSNRIRLLSSQLDSVTFLRADARIARLLAENERKGRVRLTHEEIAGIVGVSRVTVSKTLGEFAKRGWISTEYRQIVIKNREAIMQETE